MLAAGCLTADAGESDVAFSFRRGEGGGGLAAVACDAAGGRLSAPRLLYEDAACTRAMKVRFSPDGRRIGMTHKAKGDSYALVVDLADGRARKIVLPNEPDELRMGARHAVATCGDWLACLDLEQARLTRAFDAEHDLIPSGNDAEDATLLPGDEVLVTFQSDSRTGKHKGNRIVHFSLPELEMLADIALPRDHPELHIPGEMTEQGPGPEIVRVVPEADAVLVSLDLYGAVGIADWSAIRKGRLNNWAVIPTAPDGAWGQAFPDRLALCRAGGRALALVCNAGTFGGVALLDVEKRALIRHWPTPPGLDEPVVWDDGCQAAAVRAGKLKQRLSGRTEKDQEMGETLYWFDLRGESPAMEALPFGETIFAVVHPPGAGNRLVMAVRGLEEDLLLLYDLDTRAVLDRVSAGGRIHSLEAAPEALSVPDNPG